MEILPFLFFILFCAIVLVVVYGLFRILLYFGKSDADEFRDMRCPQCQTQRKPIKTGAVRNLVEVELRCPVCGYVSWDIPAKTNLSIRSSPDDPKNPQDC